MIKKKNILVMILFISLLFITKSDYTFGDEMIKIRKKFERLQFKSMESTIRELAQILKESKEVREKITGSELPMEGAPILYKVKEGKYGETLSSRVTGYINNAVKESKRYNDAILNGATTVLFLKASGIILIESTYPRVSISETMEKEELIIRVWICPDRYKAHALFWLRRGGTVPNKTKNVEAIWVEDLRFRKLSEEDSIGELAYIFNPQMVYNAPLKKGDIRAGGNRIGFIRNNIIVEAETWTYVRLDPKSYWVTMGMGGTIYGEVLTLLRAMDIALLEVEAEARNLK